MKDIDKVTDSVKYLALSKEKIKAENEATHSASVHEVIERAKNKFIESNAQKAKEQKERADKLRDEDDLKKREEINKQQAAKAAAEEAAAKAALEAKKDAAELIKREEESRRKTEIAEAEKKQEEDSASKEAELNRQRETAEIKPAAGCR